VDDNVIHVDGNVDPVRDKEIIDAELIFKDLDTAEKRLDKFKKAAKADLVAPENAEVLLISAGIEADIAELDTKEERMEFVEAVESTSGCGSYTH